MDRYKKKAVAFGSVEEKRNLRFLRKSVDRSNVRHKRLSELRKLEESTVELPIEKTAVKAEPNKMTYREKLNKWKEEKELKKKLEARKKIPVFKVCRVNSEHQPSSVHTRTASKIKEPLKFVPKPTQPSRVASKPPATRRDVPKSMGKVTSGPAPAVSSVSKFISNPKENFRTIPTPNINSRQLPASNPRTKLAVLPSRSQGNPPKSSSAHNSAVFSAASSSTFRIVKPLSSNSTAPKQIPKMQSKNTTSAASKIRNQRTGIASRIVPPRSCTIQGTTTTKTKASSDKDVKGPQKKVPPPKGIKVDAEKQSTSSRKEEEFEDSLLDSICEQKPSAEKKRATKSFAPDDFVFSFPVQVPKFAFPFGKPHLLEMYADMCGMSMPWKSAGNKSPHESKSEDQKEESKVVECKAEVALSISPKLTKEDKVVTEEEQSASLPKLKDSPIELEKTMDLPVEDSQEERKEKIQDLPLFRPLRTISENSPLPNDLDDFSGEKAYKPRRSRRLASNTFSANASLDLKYFQKAKPTLAAVSDLCSTPENPLDSPLASALSELSVDSPDTKQYHFRVRKSQQENRVSLLGSPIRPHIGPRKSIKGDLMSFTP